MEKCDDNDSGKIPLTQFIAITPSMHKYNIYKKTL